MAIELQPETSIKLVPQSTRDPEKRCASLEEKKGKYVKPTNAFRRVRVVLEPVDTAQDEAVNTFVAPVTETTEIASVLSGEVIQPPTRRIQKLPDHPIMRAAAEASRFISNISSRVQSRLPI